MKRSTGVLGLLLFVIVGCADDKELQTEFGSAKSVRAYRQVVEDVIVEANAIEREARDRAVGSTCLLYTSPSPRDRTRSRMPSSA